ncbi:MAG: HAD family hydrolase [Anaerolineales bacterium]|nr:HAD family hydrolase [Anaerolineales bacterium]
MTIKAVIFDLDDTLYPERDYVRGGFRAVGEWAGRRLNLSPVIVRAQLDSLFDGGFRGDAFQWWLSEQGLPESLLPEMVATYREHEPRIAFYPETEAVLDALKRRFHLGLVTEGRRAAQEAKIRALDLTRWIEAVVILGEKDRAQWKPSIKPFHRILGMLALAGGNAVYVGDNPRKDFRGARGAGLQTVRIRRAGGLYAGEEPAAAEDAPDREIHVLDELGALFE